MNLKLFTEGNFPPRGQPDRHEIGISTINGQLATLSGKGDAMHDAAMAVVVVHGIVLSTAVIPEGQ